MIRIREAIPGSDCGQIAQIYNYYIENTCVTYEYLPLEPDDMRGRMEKYMEDLPWLVAEEDGAILGYAYAAKYQERAAFSWDCEFSVYLHNGFSGQGLGLLLYEQLVRIVERQNYVNIYALINTPNPASKRLHEKAGFKEEFTDIHTGYKHGRWLSLMTMRRKLRDTDIPPLPIDRDWRGIYERLKNEI